MAIKIQTKTPTIPIEIGDLTLEFDMTDENIDRLIKGQQETQKELKDIKTDDVDSMKEVMKKAIDFILGDGAFEKIYNISPSVIIVADYYWSIIEGLQEEITKKAGNTQQDKVQKYLNNKKK